MKGLLLKDYYMLLKYCRPYALIVLIFGVCSLADGGNLFMLAYPAVLCGINSVSLLAYDEKSRWQQYCETMPYTRKQVVDSKYLMSFLLIAGLSVVLAAAHSLVGAVRGIFNPVWVLNIFCLIWSVGHAFSAICLPMIFKYGSEKGRVMYIAVVVVFCVAFVNFGGYDFSEVSQLSGAFAVFAENPIYMVVLAVIAAVLFMGSMKLSEQFYMKREL
ncbi:ABC-2 transporter permease [Coprococcus catus]|uniref:ABC-2 transporter permease n=1 Tax=Coprococcus catus TaxID=116085 RepID=A0A3E2XRH9_9FIRM|nr:ABC-2 transporter permease [Coprococcus catus]RGC50960.1 ABC-2 transporter permease [Coprococcus catus]